MSAVGGPRTARPTFRPNQFCLQIGFVADENPFLAGEFGEILFIRRRQRLACVENVQNEFRLRQRLAAAADALRADATLELVAMDLRIAANAVGEIVGKTATEDLLDSIFSTFCIGK